MPPSSGCRPIRQAAIVLLVLGTLFAPPIIQPVLAHKVNVFAWVDGNTVFVEGYYGGSKKAKNALIEVYDSAGTRLIQGRTDEKGEFSFEIPVKTDLRIVLTDSTGHKNDFTVSAGDLSVTTPSPAESDPQALRAPTQPSTLNVDARQLELIINQALQRKLAPVLELIRDTRREGPSVTEIIGGIGYVFGLFGVALYFKSRVQKERGQRSEVRGQQNMGKQ